MPATDRAAGRPARPTLAVWKFASCDGCQLTLLNCEDELAQVAASVQVANFPEASREVIAGPYDLSLVEGSITTPGDAERIRHVREASRFLVTIGACATSGGIQALRNFRDVDDFLSIVYARPDYIDTLRTSTPIADHVLVDFELRGCPIDRRQLLEVINAFLHGRKPGIPGLQRLPRMQAGRDHLRDGGARHAVPRPGDAGRVRGSLPILHARLLRLLRPHGDPEHRGPVRLVARARCFPPRCDPRVPHVQRELGSVPQGGGGQ